MSGGRDQIVGLAGDWHGDRLWAISKVVGMGRRGVKILFHLGDFGLWPGPNGKNFLNDLEKACADANVTVYAVPGNHDDWGRLLSKQTETRNELGPLWWLTVHLAMFPRDPAGHRFTFQGRTFVALGGAPSLDFASRTEGQTWWRDEMIPAETAERVATDGYADVMLAHDAPDHPWQVPRVAHICATNPWGWSDRALAYAATGRARMTAAFLGVKPRLFVHGHYHVRDAAIVRLPGVDYETTMLSLSNEMTGGNVALLNLQTLTILPVP